MNDIDWQELVLLEHNLKRLKKELIKDSRKTKGGLQDYQIGDINDAISAANTSILSALDKMTEE